jgi:tRNA(Ile)-lysidine synthase
MNVHSLSNCLYLCGEVTRRVDKTRGCPRRQLAPSAVEPWSWNGEPYGVRRAIELSTPDGTVLRQHLVTERYLVGVSGGRDSTTLLSWLVRAGYRDLMVCHLNHQLRGRASDADARFVKKLAEKLKLHVVIGRADVTALAVRKKLSIESAARLARYTFFAQVARRRHCRKLLLAHHADDLVETFLINLFRGAAASGLGSIRESSDHVVGRTTLQVIRPFLGIWRSEIDQYARRHRLAFREDASNADVGPLRNRIRLRVIPYLEKTVGREIRKNIWRTAMIVAEEEQWLSGLVPQNGAVPDQMSVKALGTMPVALQRRTLHKWLRGAGAADLGFDAVERVRDLLDVHSGGAARTNLPRDRHVRRRAGKLIFE